MPGGVSASKASNCGSFPVDCNSRIFLPVDSPIPLMENNSASSISDISPGRRSILKARMLYVLDLKLFSPCMSMSLDKREKWSAIS